MDKEMSAVLTAEVPLDVVLDMNLDVTNQLDSSDEIVSHVVLPGMPQEAPAALQRLWNKTRARLTGQTQQAAAPTEELLAEAEESVDLPVKKSDYQDLEVDELADDGVLEQDVIQATLAPILPTANTWTTLEGATLGDIPAVYRIPTLELHEFPVVGVFIDPRVTTGFKYIVRPIQDTPDSKLPVPLFGGKPLTLQSIGRGYSRRITFAPNSENLLNNDYYFWSDSRTNGFAFSIQVVNQGDKFTVLDANHDVQGTLEVVQLQGPQAEISQTCTNNGTIEKYVRFSAICAIHWYESSKTDGVPILITGEAIASRNRRSPASVVRIVNVAIGSQNKRGFILLPGIQTCQRRVTVDGATIGDIPAKYTIVGLQEYEIPVIGTYVDPRVIPGFHYRVRPAGSRHCLFSGRTLLLQNIGMGYGKRLTFKSDNNYPSNNYLWSDSHPDGLGFEPRAVHPGMRFRVTADGHHLGEASVFRADLPQFEESTEMVPTKSGRKAVQKLIHVEVTCHVQLATTGGGSVDDEVHLMRVSGVAVVRKDPGQRESKLIRVDKVGLDSQLNLLFVHSQTQLSFHPIP